MAAVLEEVENAIDDEDCEIDRLQEIERERCEDSYAQCSACQEGGMYPVDHPFCYLILPQKGLLCLDLYRSDVFLPKVFKREVTVGSGLTVVIVMACCELHNTCARIECTRVQYTHPCRKK